MKSSLPVLVILAAALGACSPASPDGSWTFSTDLTRAEPDFPKGAEGDKTITAAAMFLPRLTIEKNSWEVMKGSIRCTVEKIGVEDGAACENVKDKKPTGRMTLILDGDRLKLKEKNKPAFVYVREKK